LVHIGGQTSEAVKEDRKKGWKNGMAMGLNGLLTLSSRSTGVLHSNTVVGLHSILKYLQIIGTGLRSKHW